MKKGYQVLIICIVSFFMFSEAYSQVCGYAYRKRIRINYWKISGGANLTNFPVLVNIASDNDLRVVASGGHVESASGFDIVFTSDDGVTILNHQLEKYTSGTGELIAYVRVPTVYAAVHTVIYMYYGKTGVGADPSVTTTWDSNFEGVYHLHTNYNDNSQGGNNGTNSGCATGTTGKIGNCISYNSVNDHVTLGVTGWSFTAGTVECWVRSSGWNAAEGYQLGHTTLPAYVDRIQLYTFNGRVRVGMGGNHNITGDLTNLSTNTWHHLALSYSSGNFSVYVNGSSVYSGTYNTLGAIGSASLGNDGNTATNNEANAAQDIDEMRISSTGRSAGWITTSYNNQNSPSTFYTISGEGKRWDGSASSSWNTAANWVANAVPSAGDDIVITNLGTAPVMDISAQVSSIWIQTSATLSLGSFTLSDSLDITNCGTLTGSTGTATFNGVNKYYVQNISGTGTYNLKNFTANTATNQGIQLNKDVNVDGTLTLTAGLVRTTTTNILALSSNASSTSGANASFVCGPMSKAGTTAFSFPVGKGSTWRRIDFGVPSASTTYRAEYFNAAFSPLTPVVSPLHHVSSLEYWQFDRTAGAGTATVTLHWEDASAEGITLINQLRVASWSGTQWQDQGQGSFTGAVGVGIAGSITSNGAVSNFSRPFTFGAISGWLNNPLPVKLLDFTAVKDGDKVRLNWSTASEVNNDYFTVQKTLDGATFEEVMKVNGHPNSTNTISYTDYDHAPYEGQSYYRLGQTDLDGTTTFTPLQTVLFKKQGGAIQDLNLYPNPVTQGQDIHLSFSSSSKNEVLVVVMDVLGQEYFSKVLLLENGETTIAIDPTNGLAAGTYIVKAASDNNLYFKKLIVR